MAKSDESLKLDLNVKIEAYKPTLDEIKNYVQVQQQALKENSNITLNDYLKENSAHKGSNTVVVADLSGMEFDREYKDGTAVTPLLDLKGVDFSGSIIKNTSFTNCDLTDAVFCDTDLTNANFKKNNTIKNIDFRGADLATCKFSSEYKDYSQLGMGNRVEGIKFNTTSALGRQYADIKGDIFRTIEHQELVKEKEQALNAAYKNLSNVEAMYVKIGVDTGNKRYDDLAVELEQAKAGGFPNKEYTELLNKKKQEVKEAYSKLSYRETMWAYAGTDTGNEKYDKLTAEMKEIRGKPPEKDYIMHKSFQNVFSSQSDSFDPAYTRGSSKAERDQPRGYVQLSRENVVTYLDRIKTEPELSLNDFAKEIKKEELAKEGKELDPNTKYIADCSAKGNTDSTNSLKKVDLSGLDFTNAKIDGVSFAGSDLRGCNFTGADISRSSFEGADLGLKRIEVNGSTRTQGVIFDNTIARDANFFNTNFNAATIKNSDFKRAHMPRSDGAFAQIENTNFDYANIKNGKWDNVEINKATFNFANLEGISLAGADMKRVQAQHVILNNAVLNNCKVIESDFSNALMKDVHATKAKFQDTLLNDIKAPGINLSESELAGFTQLKGADLTEAILKKVKAEQIDFEKATLDKVNAEFGNFTGANLEGVKARFANLDKAVLDEAKASGVDMTGAKLTNAKARGADFTKAIMEGVDGQKADLTSAVLESANIRSANLREAILAKVNMEKAEVDAATNLAKANIKEAKGDLKEFNSKGEVTNDKKSIEEQKKQSQEIEKEKNPSWYQKGLAGKIVGGLAGVGAKIADKVREAGHKVSDFMEAKLGPKWGRIAGAVVGVVAGVMVAGAIVAATALTGGVGLAATAGIYAGCALAMGAVGTGVGHVVGKKIGVGTAIAAGVGMQMGIPPVTALAAGVGLEVVSEKLTGKNIGEHMNSAGVAAGIIASAALTGGMSLPVLLAGAGAGKGIDLAVEKLTGKTIGQLGDKALETVSAKLTEVAQSCAIDPRAKEWLVEQTKCQAVSQERLKEIEKSIGSPDRTQDHNLANNLAKQQEREVKPLEQALNEAKEQKQQQTKTVIETQQDVKVEQQKDAKLSSLQESVSQIRGNIKTQEPKLLEDKSKEPVSTKKPLQRSGGSRHI